MYELFKTWDTSRAEGEAFLRRVRANRLPDAQTATPLQRARYAKAWKEQHDELAAAWRARHVVMVERMIGTKTGTWGSSGGDYLRSRLDLRYFPLLWELRSHL